MRGRHIACGLLLGSVLLAGAAGAEPAACPQPHELQASDLYGLWQARFDDGGPGATLLLEANANWPGSLAGAVNRNGVRAQLAGDLEAGELTLEESADERRIDAAWHGEVVAGSCGREIRGAWTREAATTGRAFVLIRR
ncbi:MAG TPA: hypothetical protein VLJ86_04610 [Ramlibacter sp.]|nr:hypothetical protein [Ramlibacter sp.]